MQRRLDIGVIVREKIPLAKLRFILGFGQKGKERNLKGLFTEFEYITFFSCLNKRNNFYERSISKNN